MNTNNSKADSEHARERIKRRLHNFYDNQRIPNIIFHGSSSKENNELVWYFIDLIYNYDRSKIKNNVMFVNCAHGKGIKFIREELKFFAKTNIVQSSGSVNFKSIILLNADALSFDAQSALRRCIELFSNSSRFFMVVDNKNKLLKPILSRFCLIYIPAQCGGGGGCGDDDVCGDGGGDGDPANNMPSAIFTVLSSGGGGSIDHHHRGLMKLVTKMYDAGLSCYDLVEIAKRYILLHKGGGGGGGGRLDRLQKADEVMDLMLIFEKVRKEFRSEKLFMLFLLNYLTNRSDTATATANATATNELLLKISSY